MLEPRCRTKGKIIKPNVFLAEYKKIKKKVKINLMDVVDGGR